MADVLYKCMTKATTAEGDDIRRSLNWVTSRRGILKVTSDGLICGNWTIPYEAIDEAVLFRTRQCFIPCYVLRIKAHGTIYQFGLNPGRFWESELPFDVTRETTRLKTSAFSVVVRLIAVAAILYCLWTQCLWRAS